MGRQELSALLSSLYSMYFDKGFQKEISFFTDMIFMEADKNSDGFLAFAEFQVYISLHFHFLISFSCLIISLYYCYG